MAYGALLTLLAIGNIPSLKSEQLADLPYFIGLAVITVYIGDGLDPHHHHHPLLPLCDMYTNFVTIMLNSRGTSVLDNDPEAAALNQGGCSCPSAGLSLAVWLLPRCDLPARF